MSLFFVEDASRATDGHGRNTIAAQEFVSFLPLVSLLKSNTETRVAAGLVFDGG